MSPYTCAAHRLHTACTVYYKRAMQYIRLYVRCILRTRHLSKDLSDNVYNFIHKKLPHSFVYRVLLRGIQVWKGEVECYQMYIRAHIIQTPGDLRLMTKEIFGIYLNWIEYKLKLSGSNSNHFNI